LPLARLAGGFPSLAGLSERYLRIMAERDLLLLALEAIGKPPQLAAVLADEQV
jgi:hypothetical protein